MKIQDNLFVTLNYRLTQESGELVEESEAGEPLSFIHNAGQMIPGLEKAITGMEPGQKAHIVVAPEDAYGPRRPELLQELQRAWFPPKADVQPGKVFQVQGPHGPLSLLIESVSEETVVADLNHPLAGKRLVFDIEVVGVREATVEELAALADEGAHGSCDHGSCGGCSGGCG